MARKTERRHRQGDESRQAILDATLALAAERGYDGTTVALVQKATGLPASSIYWHFGSKDALLAGDPRALLPVLAGVRPDVGARRRAR